MIWLLVLVIPTLAIFALLEVRALRDGLPGTTLSATWWAVRESVWARLLVFGPLAWVLHHLFNPLDTHTGGWDDLAAIVAGVLASLLIPYKPRPGA